MNVQLIENDNFGKLWWNYKTRCIEIEVVSMSILKPVIFIGSKHLVVKHLIKTMYQLST